jgi:hypothetical protein
MSDDTGLVMREVMELQATPAQVREFIVTPERILDYYQPDPVEAGLFEAGRSLWCRGESGVCLLEVDEDASTDTRLVILVTMAMGLEPPYTPEAIKAAAMFTMYEDWETHPSGDGTTLTKIWRDVTPTTDLGFPLEDAIRETAKTETAPLIERWNAAARAGS